MKVSYFTIVLFPKLELSTEFQQLRERFAPNIDQPEPYIQLVLPWVPADLGEILSVIDFISHTRRNLHPLAITVEKWQRAGETIIGEITRGQEAILALRRSLTGVEPSPLLLSEEELKSHLILFRVADPNALDPALTEANRMGKTLGVIDSLYLIRTLPDGMGQRVARFPFGVGRVDYYEQLTS